SYDADGERITRTSGATTTFYLSGLWEETTSGAVKRYYLFDKEVVALRDGSTVTYLHGDHLGNVSVTRDANAASAGTPALTPWGGVRSGGISQTNLNYTGQRRDDSGLLYYHARYYDPVLGRFLSPDPQAPDLGNPQDLNLYSYVHNNPIRYTD